MRLRYLGDRLERFLRVHKVSEAHNGYLEIYLELGAIGLIFLVGIVTGAFFKAKKSLIDRPMYGRIRLVILAVFLLYNITEAGYKPTTSIFFVLLLVTIDAPERAPKDVGIPALIRNTPQVRLRPTREMAADRRAPFDDRRSEGGALRRYSVGKLS